MLPGIIVILSLSLSHAFVYRIGCEDKLDLSGGGWTGCFLVSLPVSKCDRSLLPSYHSCTANYLVRTSLKMNN